MACNLLSWKQLWIYFLVGFLLSIEQYVKAKKCHNFLKGGKQKSQNRVDIKNYLHQLEEIQQHWVIFSVWKRLYICFRGLEFWYNSDLIYDRLIKDVRVNYWSWVLSVFESETTSAKLKMLYKVVVVLFHLIFSFCICLNIKPIM